MDYTLDNVSAEFLPQPWFMKSDLYSKLQPVQEAGNSRMTPLFQEYYY